MKIVNDSKTSLIDSILKPSQTKPAKDMGASANRNGDMPDKVELSSRKEEVTRLKEKVKTTPAVNQEKVDRIKDAIKAETYDVNGRLVAKSLLKSNLLDEVL